MNSTHLVAWLTCLVVAFFACVLALLNTGRRIMLEREFRQLDARVEVLSKSIKVAPAADLNEVWKELADISAELHQMAQQPETPEGMHQKLTELGQRLRELQQKLR